MRAFGLSLSHAHSDFINVMEILAQISGDGKSKFVHKYNSDILYKRNVNKLCILPILHFGLIHINMKFYAFEVEKWGTVEKLKETARQEKQDVEDEKLAGQQRRGQEITGSEKLADSTKCDDNFWRISKICGLRFRQTALK